MPKLSWTQAFCRKDWEKLRPGVEPHVISEGLREVEKCCACGKLTDDGIYYRVDPKLVNYPRRELSE